MVQANTPFLPHFIHLGFWFGAASKTSPPGLRTFRNQILSSEIRDSHPFPPHTPTKTTPENGWQREILSLPFGAKKVILKGQSVSCREVMKGITTYNLRYVGKKRGYWEKGWWCLKWKSLKSWNHQHIKQDKPVFTAWVKIKEKQD